MLYISMCVLYIENYLINSVVDLRMSGEFKDQNTFVTFAFTQKSQTSQDTHIIVEKKFRFSCIKRSLNYEEIRNCSFSMARFTNLAICSFAESLSQLMYLLRHVKYIFFQIIVKSHTHTHTHIQRTYTCYCTKAIILQESSLLVLTAIVLTL